MFDHTQILQGGVPLKYLEVLKKEKIQPDNEEFYTIKVYYTDGVNRIFTGIPKVVFDIYIKTLLADGRTIASLQKPVLGAQLLTMRSNQFW
jgi:hypothetical protein